MAGITQTNVKILDKFKHELKHLQHFKKSHLTSSCSKNFKYDIPYETDNRNLPEHVKFCMKFIKIISFRAFSMPIRTDARVNVMTILKISIFIFNHKNYFNYFLAYDRMHRRIHKKDKRQTGAQRFFCHLQITQNK